MKKNALTLTVVANMTSNYSEGIFQVYKKFIKIEQYIPFEVERV